MNLWRPGLPRPFVHSPISDEYYQLRARLDAAVASQDTSADAVALANETVLWCRENLPAEHPELAAALVQQAWVNYYAGENSEISGLPDQPPFSAIFDEALRMQRARYGRSSEPVSVTLDALISCLMATQRWGEAIQVIEDRIAVLRELKGLRQHEVAMAERQLGDALQWYGQPDEAEVHYRRSLQIWKDDPLHSGAALTWTSWALAAEARGNFRRAGAACKRALAIVGAHWGEASLPYALSLVQLSRIRARQGAYDEAFQLQRRGLVIQRTRQGDAHADVGTSWANLAALAAAYRPGEALDISREALHADYAWVASGSAAALKTSSVLGMLGTLVERANRHLAIILGGSLNIELAAEAAATAAWRRRLPELLIPYPWLASSADLADLAAQRRQVVGGLATQMQQHTTYTNDDPSPHKAAIAWFGATVRLRHLLYRRGVIDAAFRRQAVNRIESYGLTAEQPGALQDALAPGECYVEILRLPPGAGDRYHALIVGSRDQPVAAVDLGPSQAIDSAVTHARIALEGPAGAQSFRRALPPGEPGGGTADLQQLSQLVLDPLLPFVQEYDHVILAPEGPLLHIPFGVLPVGSSQVPWLASTLISYTNAMDDIPRQRRSTDDVAPHPDIIVAAPNFGLGSSGGAAGLFTELAGTLDEAQEIATLLPGAQVFTGDQAVKSRIRSAHSPRILHLATHGYNFLEAEADELSEVASALRPPHAGIARFYPLSHEPEFMNGLALAGANTWLRHDDPGPEAETGILTVADIAGLDLAGTDLVVLSACDTGIGGIGRPEGHASLRAAFLRAGARTVVASLWQVPDSSTRRLMRRFYMLLLDGMSKGAALRRAQLERYQAGAPPRVWGGFVCYGDTGPLRSQT
jgi:CHAT domain-containing protein/tetratricopeptide (TPR) repeat protein